LKQHKDDDKGTSSQFKQKGEVKKEKKRIWEKDPFRSCRALKGDTQSQEGT
jgi:hypothetical protein